MNANEKKSSDPSKGGRLVEKKIVDKRGRQVTKWVAANKEGSEQKGKELEIESGERKNRELEIPIEIWESKVSSASEKSLKQASKYAVREEIRLLARNELFKRSFRLEKFIDLSLMPDFILDDYVSRYNQQNPLSVEEVNIINEYEKKHTSISNSQRSGNELDKEALNLIKSLEEIISKSKALSDITLHCKLEGKKDLLLANYLKGLKVGDIYEEEAFTSASLRKNTVSDFSNAYKSTNAVSIKIYVGKDQKMLNMPNNKYTFLLPKNQKFQVVEKRGGDLSVKML